MDSDPCQTWYARGGPVAVADMTREHLEAAIRFVEGHAFSADWFPALPAMRERLRVLDGHAAIRVPVEPPCPRS